MASICLKHPHNGQIELYRQFELIPAWLRAEVGRASDAVLAEFAGEDHQHRARELNKLVRELGFRVGDARFGRMVVHILEAH